jgi:mannosyltransferase OCH1-like enzyme
MIPLVLHQTAASSPSNARLRDWMRSWTLVNPGLEAKFYDDDAARELIRSYCPDCLQTFDAFPFGVMRADLFRYVVVYTQGGIYADTDMESVRPIASLLSLNTAVFGVESRVTARRQSELTYAGPWQIANCIFAAQAGHPFLAAIIERVASLARANVKPKTDHIEDITGPRMLTRLFYERRFENLTVLSQSCWVPSRSYPRCWPFNRNEHARHHFEGSWKEASTARDWRRQLIERDRLPNPFAPISHSFPKDVWA